MMTNSNASMSLRKGSKVWLEDRDTAWVAGDVTGFAGQQVQVVTESGKQVRSCIEEVLLVGVRISSCWLM
ncbi:putative myosin, SH3 [Helianthus anomalus]